MSTMSLAFWMRNNVWSSYDVNNDESDNEQRDNYVVNVCLYVMWRSTSQAVVRHPLWHRHCARALCACVSCVFVFVVTKFAVDLSLFAALFYTIWSVFACFFRSLLTANSIECQLLLAVCCRPFVVRAFFFNLCIIINSHLVKLQRQ